MMRLWGIGTLRTVWRIAGLIGVTGLMLARTEITHAQSAWVVVDARGVAFAPGALLPPGSRLALVEGARLTLIARTGRAIVLRGKFDGTIPLIEGAQESPRRALSALIASRDNKIRTIGVVRSGERAARLPDPWLIDIGRPGPRCLRAGQSAAFWRPPAQSRSLTLWPTDRSWRVDLDWPTGLDHLGIPDGIRPGEGQTLIVTTEATEFAIGFTIIPSTVDDPVLLAAWMIEKGCVQQADALLETLRERSGPGG